MFLTATPEGFARVDEVTLESGRIVLHDRKAKKQAVVASSLPL
jgi:hypothetical protein